MKKTYIAPSMEVELFELDTSIASNCATVVSNGPAMGSHDQCEDYDDPFGISTMSLHNVTFYEDTNCDCYTTGGNTGYWNS